MEISHCFNFWVDMYTMQKYENVLLHWLQMQKLYNCSVFRVQAGQ